MLMLFILNTFVRLQHSRVFQNEVATAMADPFTAIVRFLCPWLPNAKANKAARQAPAEVTAIQVLLKNMLA